MYIMSKVRTVAVVFIPEASGGRVRPMGRIFPGEEGAWQYFDPDELDLKDEKGFKISPTGWELKVDHDRFAARAVISKSLLVSPDQEESEAHQLFVLTPEEQEYELRIATAASEIGKYTMRLWGI
jgi:hypothetical protein